MASIFLKVIQSWTGSAMTLSAASAMIVVIIVMIVFMVMDLPSVGERLRVTQHLHPRFTNSITAFVTGKLGVVFKPAANGTIYAAAATSAKPPGSDFVGVNYFISLKRRAPLVAIQRYSSTSAAACASIAETAETTGAKLAIGPFGGSGAIHFEVRKGFDAVNPESYL